MHCSLFFALFGAIFIAFGMQNAWRAYELEQHGIVVQGEVGRCVVPVKHVPFPNGRRSLVYHYTDTCYRYNVAFTTKDNHRLNIAADYRAIWRQSPGVPVAYQPKGDFWDRTEPYSTVPVVYDPADPEHTAMIDDLPWEYLAAGFMILAGVTWLGCWHLCKMREDAVL